MFPTDPRLISCLALASIVLLAACSDDDDSNNTTPPANPLGGPLTVYVSRAGAGAAGDVQRTDRAFAQQALYFTGNEQGVDLDYLGNLYQAGDGANGPGVRVFSRIRDRESLDVLDPENMEREIRGANTTLVAPKGVHVSHGAGLLLVADFGASAVTVFGTTAGGDVPPLATAALAVAPWDVRHDETNDRLFVALTDGTVGVIDDFVDGGFQGAFTRVIVPADPAGARISTNLHGIVFDAAGDRLVVSDVGDPALDADGSLFVLRNASSADGPAVPSRIITGGATLLGNPVDLALDGERLRVAEKLNGGGRLMLFNGIFSGTATNAAPGFQVRSSAPESLVLEPDAPVYALEASDLEGPGVTLARVFTTRNDDANTATDDLRQHDVATLTQLSALNTAFAVESLDIDRLGDLYVTFDGGGSGSILVVNRGATDRDSGGLSAARDRVIHCDGLVSPKGIEVVEGRGLVMVAETDGGGMPGILVYSTGAHAFGVGAAPLLRIDTIVAPWDLDYDEATDRLFVALTDGTVAVFDDVLDGAAAPTAPDRTFSVGIASAPGVPYSVNLHGIVYDGPNDCVIVTDVNTTMGAGSDTDGRLFVIDNASTASGVVEARVHLEGAATLLGNPVDIAFDGVDAYIAEKANNGGRLLRFTDIVNRDTSAGTDIAPDADETAPDIESVALAPNDLAPTSGGSIVGD